MACIIARAHNARNGVIRTVACGTPRCAALLAGSRWQQSIPAPAAGIGTTPTTPDTIRDHTRIQVVGLYHHRFSASMDRQMRLHLLTPDCKLFTSSEEVAVEVFGSLPFWAFMWPGGWAIADYLTTQPQVVCGKTVLDLGCGSGVCGIAAAAAEADFILFNDIDPMALLASSLNWQLNFPPVAHHAHGECWHAPTGANLLLQPFDAGAAALASCMRTQVKRALLLDWCSTVILAGDIAYDAEIATAMITWLSVAASRGATVLLGDPGRSAFLAAVHPTAATLSGCNDSGRPEAGNAAPATIKQVHSVPLPAALMLENSAFSEARVVQLIVAQ